MSNFSLQLRLSEPVSLRETEQPSVAVPNAKKDRHFKMIRSISHLDLAGLVECRNTQPGRYLTVGIDKMKFVKPVFVGDLVKIYTGVEKIGRTSTANAILK